MYQKRVTDTHNVFLSTMLHSKATTDVAQRLIVPMLRSGHFYVVCFDFSVHDPCFFIGISFYDSYMFAGVSILIERASL